jgi:hypothetical protein
LVKPTQVLSIETGFGDSGVDAFPENLVLEPV